MRAHLIANRVRAGVIIYPPYMAGGEMRLEDPDRYVLLVGQLRRSAAVDDGVQTRV